MFKLLRRIYNYITAAGTQKFNEVADPKVQLEQALAEAQDQHRRLTSQAANVIANQKQTELRLNRAMEELEKVNGSARQAVLMADQAAKAGDQDKAGEYTRAAEAFANRLVAVESEVESLKTLSLQSAQAADQAKSAVMHNSSARWERMSAPAPVVPSVMPSWVLIWASLAAASALVWACWTSSILASTVWPASSAWPRARA